MNNLLLHPSKSDLPPLGYQKNLDGLRAIAVLMVFFFHCELPLFQGAFIGVDIFFVLSGFLITTILYEEYQKSGKILLHRFYLRRIRRLFPALAGMLLLFCITCFIFFKEKAIVQEQLRDVLYVLFYISNWTRAFGLEHPNILGHCWSLSIEEQFYLIYPLLILTLIKHSPRRQILTISALLICSTIWRIYLLRNGADWNRLYNGFGTRADMLLFGCLLALIRLHCSPWLLRIPESLQTLSSLLAIGYLVFFAITGDWQTRELYLYSYSLIGLCTAGLILTLCLQRTSIVSQFLSLSAFTGLGRISYGFYLYHYPVISFLILKKFSPYTVMVLSCTITSVLALLSYHLLEKQFLPAYRRQDGSR